MRKMFKLHGFTTGRTGMLQQGMRATTGIYNFSKKVTLQPSKPVHFKTVATLYKVMPVQGDCFYTIIFKGRAKLCANKGTVTFFNFQKNHSQAIRRVSFSALRISNKSHSELSERSIGVSLEFILHVD